MKKHVFPKVIAVFLAALLLSGRAPQTTGQESTASPPPTPRRMPRISPFP